MRRRCASRDGELKKEQSILPSLPKQGRHARSKSSKPSSRDKLWRSEETRCYCYSTHDSTAAVKATLWEANIDSVKEHTSYEFRNFNVHMYKHEKYLFMPKDGADSSGY